jgi:predicted amidophosphoribosyltransferase
MTLPQTAIHKPARRQANVRGAFRLITPEDVAGKRIIVVDDVRTTGATLGEVARVLRPCGPVSLMAIVLCVADHRGRQYERVSVPGEKGPDERA